jgi:hypothetical protein
MDAALFANDAARAAKRSSPTGADVSQAIRNDGVGKHGIMAQTPPRGISSR